MVKIRSKNSFLLLLLIVVIILAFFIIQNFDIAGRLSNLSAATTSAPTPTEVPVEIQFNVAPDTLIKSPFTLVGKIDSSWVFEASFPVSLYDENNKLIVTKPARVSGEWTTPGLKDFTVTLNFKTTASKGYLQIANDNPSGLPQNQKSYRIPVKFTN